MSAQRTVSIQEVVRMVDNQDLAARSEKFTCLSLRQGAALASKKAFMGDTCASVNALSVCLLVRVMCAASMHWIGVKTGAPNRLV